MEAGVMEGIESRDRWAVGGGSQRQGERPRVRKWVSCDFLESRGVRGFCLCFGGVWVWDGRK